MATQNSNRFLTAFNRIDHRLRDIFGAKDFMPFYRLVDQAKKKDVLVRKYEDDLRSYADLRNEIVQHQTSLEFVIAEPHTDVVEILNLWIRHLQGQRLLGKCSVKKYMFSKKEIP